LHSRLTLIELVLDNERSFVHGLFGNIRSFFSLPPRRVAFVSGDGVATGTIPIL